MIGARDDVRLHHRPTTQQRDSSSVRRRLWGRCSNQHRPTVCAGVQFDCDGMDDAARMDAATAASGQLPFPRPAPDVPG